MDLLKRSFSFSTTSAGAFSTKDWFAKSKKQLSKKEIEEIEILINNRNLARQDSNFELADEIREQLRKKGVVLEDVEKESKWKLNNG